MSETEFIADQDLSESPVRAPDLVISRLAGEAWVVEVLSRTLAHWTGLDNHDARGRLLKDLYPEVSPELDYLAEEVLDRASAIRGIVVHFLSPGDCRLQADVLAGGLSEDRYLRQVHFYFRPLAVGKGRWHPPSGKYGLVGSSPGMLEVYRKIGLYAESDAPVVVTGETGTGKELAARALHEEGDRRSRAFVAVNCSAISAELLESELFGHEKGAFTGAVRMHRGRFERAHLGTIFLDEIGDMPMHAQAKLLRILEEGSLERVGSEQTQRVDVRVIGATNVPLEKMVREGRFRADLYHRIAVLRVHMPALRQRAEDIPLLVEYFLETFRRKYQKSIHRLTSEAMALLQSYLWPGNVRELRNVLERVFVETHAEVIGVRAFRDWVNERQDFSPGDWSANAAGDVLRFVPPFPLDSERVLLPNPRRLALAEPASGRSVQVPSRTTKPADLDAEEIKAACLAAGGNLTAAARLLGVHRATLYRYLKKLGLSRQELGC